MRFRFLILLSCCAMFASAQSSRQIVDRNLFWAVAQINGKLNTNWSLGVDGQARYDLGRNEWFQWLVRPSVTYTTSKNQWIYTAGLAYFSLYPSPNTKPPRPEIRPWQEFGKKFVLGKHILYPRLRTEQRFIRGYAGDVLDDKFSWNAFRTRWRLEWTWNLSSSTEHGLFLFSGDELFIGFKPNNYTAFDQNRFYIGPGWKFSPAFSVHLNYLNLFLQQTGSRFESHHTIRATVIYNMNFVKKQEVNK